MSGTRGLAFFAWAARNFDDTKFRDWYAVDYHSLQRQHEGNPDAKEALKRLRDIVAGLTALDINSLANGETSTPAEPIEKRALRLYGIWRKSQGDPPNLPKWDTIIESEDPKHVKIATAWRDVAGA